MNIHINKSQYEILMQNTFFSMKIGSHLYGCNNDSSDTDYIHIYAMGSSAEKSISWSHHNFQYKDQSVDHVFSTLQNFLRNIIKGDSTINYECLFSQEFENSEIGFISDLRKSFNNYSLIKAYIGLVKRDLKFFDHNFQSKKLFHALRGAWSIERILENEYSNNIREKDHSIYLTLMKIKNNQLSLEEMKQLALKINKENDQMRALLNDKLNAKMIQKYMNINEIKRLDQEVINFCKSEFYQSFNHEIEVFDDLYDSLENEVSYSK